jgi:hypothetical protein
MKQQTPLYGTIPYFGGSYSITFAHEGTTTSSLMGYGDFPYADFPYLPVIDYRDNDAVFLCMAYPTEQRPGYGGDLEAFLAFHKAHNVPILKGGDHMHLSK